MTRIGILDDEVIICETLSKYLREMGYEVPAYAMSYDEGIEMIAEHKPDIMLLDINLGDGKSGIDFAKYLRQHNNIPLIFISSYSDKSTVEKTLEAQPNGYLIKPFTRENLFVTIETALSNFSVKESTSQNDYKLMEDALFIKQDALFIKVYFKEILYIKSDGVYAEIFTSEKKLLIRETLKHLLNILPTDSFYQLHRSYIVNIHKIDAVNSEYVLIQKEHLPISRTNREEFLKRLNII